MLCHELMTSGIHYVGSAVVVLVTALLLFPWYRMQSGGRDQIKNKSQLYN